MSAQPLHLLIVEDDENHRDLILRNLRRSKVLYTVHVAADGSAALDYLRHPGDLVRGMRPDLILLDLNLPKVNGLEVLGAIKNEERLRSIPVIILTTSDNDGDRLGAYSRHANSYVVKPADFTEFRTLIDSLTTYWGRWNRRLR